MENKDLFINLINTMFSSYLKIKEIHWNTKNQAKHTLSDNASEEILEVIDELAELYQGSVDERFGLGVIKVSVPDINDLKTLLKGLKMRCDKISTQLSTDDCYNGIVSVIDDFSASLAKFIYLSDNQ